MELDLNVCRCELAWALAMACQVPYRSTQIMIQQGKYITSTIEHFNDINYIQKMCTSHMDHVLRDLILKPKLRIEGTYKKHETQSTTIFTCVKTLVQGYTSDV